MYFLYLSLISAVFLMIGVDTNLFEPWKKYNEVQYLS